MPAPGPTKALARVDQARSLDERAAMLIDPAFIAKVSEPSGGQANSREASGFLLVSARKLNADDPNEAVAIAAGQNSAFARIVPEARARLRSRRIERIGGFHSHASTRSNIKGVTVDSRWFPDLNTVAVTRRGVGHATSDLRETTT